jgi:hypothetical protein
VVNLIRHAAKDAGPTISPKVNSHHPSELQPELFFNYFSRMTQQGKFEYYLPAKNPSTIGIQSIFSLLAGLENKIPPKPFL